MKIYAILDHPHYNRTILGVIEKWKEQGHEVQVDMYYDINKALWADIIFGDYIQGGVVGCVNDADTHKKPMVIRGIDIDLYYGHYMGIDWSKCKAVLFICDYMRKFAVESYIASHGEPKCHIEVVNIGIDPDKWTFSDKSVNRGKTVGWINNFWSGKGVELLCQIIFKLVKIDPEYKFEVVGEGSEPWLNKYFDEFISRNNLSANVKRIKYVESVDDWMNHIDYILSTSMKECFSLPMAEGMAKGIKPVIHHWWGADEIYPSEFIFESVDQAIDIITSKDYDSQRYRQYILDHYTLEKHTNNLNRILCL